jgi:hypothetical protein
VSILNKRVGAAALYAILPDGISVYVRFSLDNFGESEPSSECSRVQKTALTFRERGLHFGAKLIAAFWRSLKIKELGGALSVHLYLLRQMCAIVRTFAVREASKAGKPDNKRITAVSVSNF